MRMFITRHVSRLWREPALWLGLLEASAYLGLLAYLLNVVRSAIGD
jgi:hypothetical protein